MIARLPAAAVLLCALASYSAEASEKWIRLATPDFEMYTTNSAKEATSALKIFEQVRYFFVQTSHSNALPEGHVRIIAFRSEKQYKPYRFNEGAFAYYLRTRGGDFIVMQDISSEHYRTAVHEYTHLIVEHLGLNLPVWLNEGMADLYSTLEPKGAQAMVGRPLEGHLQVLYSERWLDLNTLFAVDHDSPYYNESKKMSIFYAESWALTHMLMLGNDYRPGFVKFLCSVASGRSAAESIQTVYGKNLGEIMHDLQAYTRRPTIAAALFDVQLPKVNLDSDVSEPSELSVQLTLAELLAGQKRFAQEAGVRLHELASVHPENAEIQEALAYLAWEQGDVSSAQARFKLAIEKGTNNPDSFYGYAQLLEGSGAPPGDIIPLLQRAAALKPDYTDAWLNLGAAEIATGQCGLALDALSHIKRVTPDRAYGLFSEQAYCYLRLNRRENAKQLIARAKQYANTPDEEQRLATLERAAETADAR